MDADTATLVAGVVAGAGLALFFPLVAFSAFVVAAAAAVAPLAVAAFDARARPLLRVAAAGKAVLVTGCDSGFGLELTRRLDAEGARVFAGCLTEEGVKRLRREGSARVRAFLLDVTRQESVDAAVELVRAEAGALHAVVNNAGVVRGYYAEMTTMEQFRACMEVNYFGLVAVSKAALPLLRLSPGGGRVVNVTSVAGRLSGVATSAYAASKHAAEAFSDSLRQEAPCGTRVSLVEPGFTRTPMTAEMDTMARRAYEAAPAAVQEVYGGEAFWRSRQARAASIKALTAGPEPVIEALCDAVLSRLPKHRYLVGHDATLVYPWLWRLPSFVVDRLVTSAEGR